MMAAVVWLTWALAPVSAQGQPTDRPAGVVFSSNNLLSLTGSSITFHLQANLPTTLPDALLVVDVFGPGDPSHDTESLPRTGGSRQEVGDISGIFAAEVPVEAEWLAEPGAYLVKVAIESGNVNHVVAESLLGRIAADAPIVDLALVVPIALGIWQEPEGTFVGGEIEQGPSPTSGAFAVVFSLPDLLDISPETRLTVAVEPVLLAQLEDAADGFVARTPDGNTQTHDARDTVSLAAESALQILRGLAQREGVQLLPLPYATPSLPLLAVHGWNDGVSQVRLGKAELARILGVAETPRGALPPGLDLSSDSVAAFSGASVDYVVVKAAVMDDLAETPTDPLGPVRIADAAGNRLTVVPVARAIASALANDGQPANVCAAIATALAEGSPRSLVICPEDEYMGFNPESLAEVMRQAEASGAFRTVTLGELVERHLSERRPVFLSRYAAHETGLIAQTLLREVGAARSLVADYLSAAGNTTVRAGAIAELLFRAESRHWLRADLGPERAELGVRYAHEARQAAEREMGLLTIEDVRVETDTFSADSISVSLRNSSAYSWTVAVVLRDRGSEGTLLSSQITTLEPGLSTVALQCIPSNPADTLRRGLAPGTYAVEVRAGSSTIASQAVRVTTPWLSLHWVWLAVAGAALALVVLMGTVARCRATRRRAAGSTSRRLTRRRSAPS